MVSGFSSSSPISSLYKSTSLGVNVKMLPEASAMQRLSDDTESKAQAERNAKARQPSIGHAFWAMILWP